MRSRELFIFGNHRHFIPLGPAQPTSQWMGITWFPALQGGISPIPKGGSPRSLLGEGFSIALASKSSIFFSETKTIWEMS